MDLLIAYDWQGNVRQLCNEVQRIVARADDGDRITPGHLSPEIKPGAETSSAGIGGNARTIGLTGGAISVMTDGASLDEALAALEMQMITDSIKRHQNNVTRVAKELGITRRGLYLKLERYNLRT
jgi:Nif-specific regulatory protein